MVKTYKRIKKTNRSRRIRGGDSSTIENNIYNFAERANENSKFKLGFTFKGKYYSTTFVFNHDVLNNGCISLQLIKLSEHNEYDTNSYIKANRGNKACFEPRLETTETPVRITSTDILQVLSTKIKIILNKKLSPSIGDVATINGVYISPYRILRGYPPIYEKYGYKNKKIDNIRTNILPKLKWYDIRDKMHIQAKELIEKYNPIIDDNDTILELMKNIPFDEEQKTNISTYILYTIIGYIDSLDILDTKSPEWMQWSSFLKFVDFEIL